MFNSLSEKLESAFKNIKGEGRITELNIANTVKEIRRALSKERFYDSPTFNKY